MPTHPPAFSPEAIDEARSRLIFALDYPNLEAAKLGASKAAPAVGMFKVGLELFLAHGHEAVAIGEAHQRPIFLDLKLHDIPATVGRAAARAATLGVRYLTVHAAGGPAMLQHAVAACEGSEMDIIAVTVLTSMDREDLRQTGVADDPAAQATRLACMAYENGVRHFVCSPAEVARLKAALGDDARFITPGVRPQNAEHGDQKRVATPGAAIRSGSNMLVVGRPIRDADDPATAARAIVEEIAMAHSRL